MGAGFGEELEFPGCGAIITGPNYGYLIYLKTNWKIVRSRYCMRSACPLGSLSLFWCCSLVESNSKSSKKLSTMERGFPRAVFYIRNSP